MGFFDALFGTNTNAALNKAAQQSTAWDATVHNSVHDTLAGSNIDAQRQLSTTADNATRDITDNTGSALNALLSQGGAAQGQLAGGVDRAAATVQGSNGQYAPYVANGQGANEMFADSLGLNGPAGSAAAHSAFQASPGYQYQVDQATDAATRKAAALGMAGSGNTLDAITRLGSNLADQEYGNWQSKLQGLGSEGLSAAGAVSGNNATAAGYQYGGGTAGASLAQQLGSSMGNAYTNQGTALGTIQTGLGSQLASQQQALGTSMMQNDWHMADAQNQARLQNAQQQDATTNANNGIFSKLIGKGLNVGLGALGL